MAKPDAADSGDLGLQMREIGRTARAAAAKLALASADAKNGALLTMAAMLRNFHEQILIANAEDVDAARKAGRLPYFIDRLTLNPARIEAMAKGLEDIAELPDPVGEVIASWTRPNGLVIERVRVPLGVIGMIFESRPNVTADAGGLCLKSGNAVILRGGSDGLASTRAIHAAMVAGLRQAGLDEAAIQIVDRADREAVGMMLAGLDGAIDVIVPRGGKSLVARVQQEARVPVFAHLDGVNHVYVHEAADPEMARAIVLNAKMRRTGVCGAAETLLVDEAAAPANLAPLIGALIEAGCEVRGDAAARAADARVKPASEEDWGTEYLEAIIAVKTVAGLEAAMAHIARYGSQHTDAIVTEDDAAAERFLREVDSAIVLHNASTQFADGGEFGMGAEIGIATGRFHARGPVGAEQLTSFKYRVRGTGQLRPV
ncbi:MULTISPECIES: glutamate-5-semialdehyde dehydrogenase [Rhodomicrobium]|uniref:glutamate-5-semialdehyde dehydrogenase n=2 Tax=Rhodomicrobium TaxID=1068 RepID=UPI000B4BC16E